MKRQYYSLTILAATLVLFVSCADSVNKPEDTSLYETNSTIILTAGSNNPLDSHEDNLDETNLLPPDANADGYVNVFIDFPANEVGKSEFNTDIFNTKFTLSVSMPDGKTINADIIPDLDIGISGAFSNVPIYDENGGIAGYVAYNTYSPEIISGLSGEEIDPMMIYNQIGLAAHYSFTVKDRYDIVSDNDSFTTALTDVYNDLNFIPHRQDGEEYNEGNYNFGIVSYSKDIPVYVAFDLYKNAFTLEQVEEIAKSISFTNY
jgi:hypothetical protein